MARPLFSVLAAVVTLGGLAAVVWAGRLASERSGSRRKTLASFLILAYATGLVLQPRWWPVIDIEVLAGAVGGVVLLERGLRTPGAVLVFLIVAAAADVISLSGGLSRMLVERYRSGAGDLLLYLTLVVPVAGRTIPIVGIGDLLVGGTAATALLRLGLPRSGVLGAVAAGLMAALAYGLGRGGSVLKCRIMAAMSGR